MARSTFGSQNVQSTPKHTNLRLLEVDVSKKCMLLWREAHFEVRSVNIDGFRALSEVQMLKKCTLLRREAHFEVKMLKKHHMFGPLLDVQISFRVAGARDCAPCQK